MSHFTRLKTHITDTNALRQALADIGFPEVEVYATAQPLVGFEGSQRAQTAELIIRRGHIGWLSNDIGFKRSAEGTFEAVISEYDRTWYSQAWLNRLLHRYAYHATRARLKEQGFDLIQEEQAPDGRIHLRLRRMV